MRTIQALPLVGGGFLLSVLWFDLKFDVLVWDVVFAGAAVEPGAIAGMQAYYTQALGTESGGFPLVSFVMGVSIASLLAQLRAPAGGRGRWLVSLALLVPPIALAGARIVPNAAELARSAGPLAEQGALATSILVDHVYCFASIASFLVLELVRLHVGTRRSPGAEAA